MTDDPQLPINRRTLLALRDALAESPLIVELKLVQYDEPERLVFYRYELLLDYLRRVARPGDTLTAWRFDVCCTTDNAVIRTATLGARIAASRASRK